MPHLHVSGNSVKSVGSEVNTLQQVKSKKRVADHGEVFTAEREVNAMLDLVKNETERIESRFLEPACGEGNFLAEILRRKLAVAQKKYGDPLTQPDYEMWSVIAVMNIYGVELLADNAADCRKRLFEIWDEAYSATCKKEADNECRDAVRYILELNILCADFLMQKKDAPPIIFAEWSFVGGTKVKRRDFRLDKMLEGHEYQGLKAWHRSLPGIAVKDQGQTKQKDKTPYADDWVHDKETHACIPKPINDKYPLTDYRRVWEHGC